MRSGVIVSLSAGLVALLAACESAPRQEMAAAPATEREPEPQQQQMVWVRTDGQRGSGNPELESEYARDVNACPGAAAMSPDASDCMRERGYILVPIEEADATLEAFRREQG